MKKITLLSLLILAVYFLPDVALAQGGFVPCSGAECSACHFVSMANTIIVWLIGAMFVLFAVLMAIAGFGLVTSGGNQSALDDAKSKFQNAVVGIIIVMSAFLIVDTLMKGVLKGGTGEITGFGPWSEVQCQVQTNALVWEGDPQSTASGTPPVAPLPVPASTGCSGGTCAPLGIPCTAGCNIAPDLVSRFQAFHAAAGVSGARVTEAMPPTRVHKSKCHSNGTCIDYSKSGGMTATEVVQVINAARANNLRPVYEVHTQAQKDALVSAGAPAENVKVLGTWISAPHFSIYGY